jgi:hypothetical protein
MHSRRQIDDILPVGLVVQLMQKSRWWILNQTC